MTQSMTYQDQAILIKFVLANISKRQTEIKNYYKEIHTKFFELKQNYPNYFSRLFFNENGHIPYSEDLDAIIQDFQVAGVVNKLNPGFNTLIINKIDSSEVEAKIKTELPEIQISDLKAICSDISI